MLYLLFFEERSRQFFKRKKKGEIDETYCHREQLGAGPDPISTVVVAL